MLISTTIDGQRLVHSGVVILEPHEKRWVIKVEDLEYSFEFNDQEGSPKADVSVQTEKGMLISLAGFSNKLGTSYVLRNVGFVDDEAINLAINVTAIGKEGDFARTVLFSVTASPKAADE